MMASKGLPTADALFPGAFIKKAEFSGIDGIEGFPSPDATIAAGPSSLVIARNHRIEIRSKSGTVIASKSTYGLFESVIPMGEGVTDPIVVYDPRSGRFFFIQSGTAQDLGCTPGNCLSHYLLAVSKSSTPGSLEPDDWHVYALDRTLDQYTPTANWGDFDHLSMNDEVVVITSNMYSFADNPPPGPKIRVLDKSKLIQGDPIDTWSDFVGLRHPDTGTAITNTILPAIQFGDPNTLFLVSGTSGCGYLIWGVEPPFTSPTLSSRTVTPSMCVGTYGLPNAEQPGAGVPLDVGAFNASPVYRNGSLWVAQPWGMDYGSGDVSAVRWSQIDVSDWPNSAKFVQDSIFGTDGVWRFAPGIMVDASNNLALVYAQSSATEYASAYFAGRLGTDPPNGLSFRESNVLKAGTTTLAVIENGRNRFTDYFGIALDPVDQSVWMMGFYAGAADRTGTWLGNVAFDPAAALKSVYLPLVRR